MKKIALSIVLSMCTILAFSQVQLERQVIGSAGTSASQGNIQLEYTVGEAVVTTESGGSIILTQGFNQPTAEPVGIDIPDYNLSIQAYPNPTSTQLILEVEKTEDSEFIVLVYNELGQLVPDKQIRINQGTKQTVTMDFSEVAAGQYFLEVRSDEASLKTVPVQVVR